MSPKLPKVPSYQKHKSSGKAKVRLSGKDYYLGEYGTPESEVEYKRLIAEWMSRGQAIPQPASDTLVIEVAAAYTTHVKEYFAGEDGEPTPTATRGIIAMQELTLLHGRQPVATFGPLALQSIQKRLADRKCARGYINSLVKTIRAAFKWASSVELIPSSLWHDLQSVSGLRRGRSAAREPDPVEPVADEVIEATIPHLPVIVASMVKVQRLTGMRPAEVCGMTPGEIDRTSDPWIFRPTRHKTEHHGKVRSVALGPKAQAILLPYLLRESGSPCFRPDESEAARKIEMRENRKSKVQPSQVNRAKPKRKRRPTDRYETASYRRCIARACVKAGVETWSPNQLRHAAATDVRKRYGLEAAQNVLGHSTARITEIYAERDLSLASRVAREVG